MLCPECLAWIARQGVAVPGFNYQAALEAAHVEHDWKAANERVD